MSSLQIMEYTIAAGASEAINGAGEFYRIIAAGGPVGVQIDAKPENQHQAGHAFRLSDGERFSRLRIYNRHDSPQTITIAFGVGQFDDASLSLSGTVTVDDGSGASFDTVRTGIDLLRNERKENDWLDFTGTQIIASDLSNHEFVTAAQNVNGVELVSVLLSHSASTGNSGFGVFEIDGEVVMIAKMASVQLQKVFVPAGKALKFRSSGDAYGYFVFRVLA